LWKGSGCVHAGLKGKWETEDANKRNGTKATPKVAKVTKSGAAEKADGTKRGYTAFFWTIQTACELCVASFSFSERKSKGERHHIERQE
jgi:hypothetical protein